ncbi:hypothetical protein LZC95_20090 [Pendulispora brunnea]|uniref:PEGA domain-containing protein n=1 Tax=Pendulispora brunnea TaxID=2905690 RepID=A0ABZ2KM35_9BACT
MADEDAQRWREALGKLERAGGIKLTSGILTHIAVCKDNLGRLLEALSDYEKAGQMAQAERNKEVLNTVKERLPRLRARIPSIKVTTPEREGLEVEVERVLQNSGGEMYLTLGTLPRSAEGDFRLQVDPGQYVVIIRAPHTEPYRTKQQASEGQVVSIEAALEPERVAQPAPVTKPLSPAPPVEHEREHFWTTRNTVAIALVGAGVIGIAGGVGFGLAGQSDKNEVERLRAQLPPSATPSQCFQPTGPVSDTCAQLADAISSQNTKADMSLGFYIGGGALLAAGAATWLLWPKAKSTTQTGYLAPVVDFHSRSLGVQGAF